MKHAFKPQRILWVDLEMTGLDPVHDEILEVAAIATDWDFHEIATFEGVVRHEPAKLKRLLDRNAAFWDANLKARRGLEAQNDSGKALGPMLSYYKIDTKDLIVVHDDMDIPAGAVRIRTKGGSGGHNGIKSIISHVGTEEFPRVRIGIGRPPVGWTVINHVLTPFSTDDASLVGEAIGYLLPAVEYLVTDGVDMAMNRFNPRKKKTTRDV